MCKLAQKKYKTSYDWVDRWSPGNCARDWNLTMLTNGICPNQNFFRKMGWIKILCDFEIQNENRFKIIRVDLILINRKELLEFAVLVNCKVKIKRKLHIVLRSDTYNTYWLKYRSEQKYSKQQSRRTLIHEEWRDTFNKAVSLLQYRSTARPFFPTKRSPRSRIVFIMKTSDTSFSWNIKTHGLLSERKKEETKRNQELQPCMFVSIDDW